MHALPALFYYQLAIKFIREAVTMRTALVAAGFCAILSAGFVFVDSEQIAICLAGEQTLVYPVYNKRGVIVDETVKCGPVHRGCTQRTNDTGYDCSPFMAPKEVISRR